MIIGSLIEVRKSLQRQRNSKTFNFQFPTEPAHHGSLSFGASSLAQSKIVSSPMARFGWQILSSRLTMIIIMLCLVLSIGRTVVSTQNILSRPSYYSPSLCTLRPIGMPIYQPPFLQQDTLCDGSLIGFGNTQSTTRDRAMLATLE